MMVKRTLEETERQNRHNACHLRKVYNRPIVIRCEHCGSALEPERPLPPEVSLAAETAFNLGSNVLLSNNRQKRLVFARMAICWHMMANYGWTYRELAAALLKDRATIYHYLACHHNRLRDDDRYITGYARFTDLISVDKMPI